MRKTTLKSLRKKADKIFSLYIRQRDKGICCTCKTVLNWNDGDAGHYINRTKFGTKYNERNCHFQCRACNRFKKPMAEYAQFMYEKYGDIAIKDLLIQSHWNLPKFVREILNYAIDTQREAYNRIIDYYSKKLENLK